LSAEPIITVESLAFERNHRLLLAPTDFSLETGEALHIQGSNGSGKTTLFRLLMGLLQPTQGEISFRGQSIGQCRHSYLSELLFIGHRAAIKETLTVEENLRWLSPNPLSPDQVRAALSAVELDNYADIPCRQLSAGQRRRVALARLINSKVKLWYLDEPLAALDKQGMAVVEQCMQSHLQVGGSIIFSSHQDLAQTATRNYSLTAEGSARD
jgi:heme exporter protein A